MQAYDEGWLSFKDRAPPFSSTCFRGSRNRPFESDFRMRLRDTL